MEYVAVTIDNEEELAEFISQKSGWVTVKLISTGGEHKFRPNQVNFEPDMSGIPVTSNDVIPQDVRDTYEQGKTEDGVSYIDSGDDLAVQLRGKPIEESAKVLAKLDNSRSASGWIAFYTTDREAEGKKALNDGMVRMNIGNRIRAALKAQAEEQAA